MQLQAKVRVTYQTTATFLLWAVCNFVSVFLLKEEEMFRPNMFFLLLLPPIIFESGYSLHKVQQNMHEAEFTQLSIYV